MTAFRTTRPTEPTSPVMRARRARFVALLALPLALSGCGSPTAPITGPASSAGRTDDPAWVTLRTRLPAPDADRITYDEQNRTLTLYDLPGNDRWMIQMPADEVGRPAAQQQRIPTDAKLSQITVYYVRPGLKPSATVSVQQIRDVGLAHNSLAILK